ncbi:MAG TPA: type 4a pilus biogenesis protein PilO [Gaiellaceae bacterium]|nr:type 4a pilus biogenesis protein PilO [Gaiellaceae bacterium]
MKTDLRNLSPTVRIALTIVGALLVAAIGYLGLIRPEGSKVKHLQADQATAQATLTAYNQKVAAARSAPKITYADVYRLAKAMPTEEDMPDVLLELSQLAQDTGITFNEIQPQTEVPQGSYTVMPISVTFDGNYYNLADFLYRLRTLVDVNAGHLDATGRLFSVDTLSFAEGTKGFPQVQATMTIDAFVYGPGQAAAGSSSSTPASTTTTTTDTTSAAPPTTPSTTDTTPTTTAPGTSASAAGAGAP